MCPEAGVSHLTIHHSDHCPLLLETCADMDKHPRPFRFFEAGLSDDSCKGVVEKAWENEVAGPQSIQLVQRCKRVQKGLRLWNKIQLGYTH